MQHCNTRPSGGSSEKIHRVKFLLRLLLTKRRQNNWPSLQFVITSECRVDCLTFTCIHLKKKCTVVVKAGDHKLSYDKTLQIFPPPLFIKARMCISFSGIFSLQMTKLKTQQTTHIQTAIFIRFHDEGMPVTELTHLSYELPVLEKIKLANIFIALTGQVEF